LALPSARTASQKGSAKRGRIRLRPHRPIQKMTIQKRHSETKTLEGYAAQNLFTALERCGINEKRKKAQEVPSRKRQFGQEHPPP